MKSIPDAKRTEALKALAHRAVQDEPNLWPIISHRITPRHAPFSPFLRLAIPIFVLVLIGILVGMSSPKGVSAATILARAQQATENATQVGLNSYRGIIDGKMQITPDSTSSEWVYWQTHAWFEIPDKWRREFYLASANRQVIPRFNNAQMRALALSQFVPHDGLVYNLLERVTIEDGNEAWDFGWGNTSQTINQETIYHTLVVPGPPDFKSYSSILLATDNILTSATSLDDATEFLSARFNNVTRQEDATIAGRSVYTIVFTSLKPDMKLQSDDEIVTAWYDQQTYGLLGLRLETKIHGQFQRWGEWQFSDFEANPTLAAETFVFRPPVGVPIQDQMTSRTPTP